MKGVVRIDPTVLFFRAAFCCENLGETLLISKAPPLLVLTCCVHPPFFSPLNTGRCGTRLG